MVIVGHDKTLASEFEASPEMKRLPKLKNQSRKCFILPAWQNRQKAIWYC
jgi:hypothetical protein